MRSGDGEVTLGDARVRSTFAATEGELVLGVRPEAIEIGGEGIEGKVARATFLGERTELSIETAHGEVRADVSPSRRFAEGDAVRLRIAEGRAYPLPR